MKKYKTSVLSDKRNKELEQSAIERKDRKKKRLIKQLMKPEVREKALRNAAKSRFFKVKTLNEKQHKAIMLMADFMNDWSPEYICGQCNICLATLYNWRNDPFFIKELDKEITRRKTMFRLEAHRRLFKQVKKGNPRLILQYLKMVGDFAPEKMEIVEKEDVGKLSDGELDKEIERLQNELGLRDSE